MIEPPYLVYYGLEHELDFSASDLSVSLHESEIAWFSFL
jgi:hypothetical protein